VRSLAAGLLTLFRAEAPKPVVLVEISTGLAATPTMRLCDREYSLAWGGQVWTGRPAEAGEIRVEAGQDAEGPTITLGDVDRTFRALLTAGAPFVGLRVVLRLTDESLCTSGAAADTAYRDDFLTEQWETPEGKFVLHLKPFASVFDLPLPRTTVTRAEFPGIPRDATWI